MHSFHQSRVRILLDVLCALGLVVCCVGAWKQTGASALVGAAGVAGLYAFVRLFDLRHGKPAKVVEPQRIAFEPEPEVEPVAEVSAVIVPMVAPEPVVELEEPPARASGGRRTGGSRKGTGRRTKASKPPKVVDVAPPSPVEAEEADLRDPIDEEFLFPSEEEEAAASSQIAPLFEPEPFARMQRRAFGRRGRL